MHLLNFIVVVLTILLLSIYRYYKVTFSYWRSQNVPYLEPKFPYGNFNIFSYNFHPAHSVQRVYHFFKGTDKFCGVFFYVRPMALLLDLDLIKNVLILDFQTFNERGLYYNEKDDPISAHLLAIEGSKWRRLRAKLTPTFTSMKMKIMFPTVVAIGERFRDCLREIVEKDDVLHIQELLARFTTDVIGTCAFGIECNSLKDPNAEFRVVARSVFERPRHNMFFEIILSGFKDTARMLGIKQVRDRVSEFFTNVVKDTIKYRETNNISRNDFMDLLIKMKNENKTDDTENLTINEIVSQSFVFFLASFETSSTTLAFCLYELAFNKDIQTKTRSEIKNALKRHGDKLTYEAMMDMPYVNCVLQETLRKYPPAANLQRITQCDYEVPDSKHVIKKGMPVIIPVYAIHHDPIYYPEPEVFKPERFTPEQVQKRHSMSFLAFGEGPRNCIGLRFAMMQAKIALITLLSNYEFSICSQTTSPLTLIQRAFVLSPKDKIFLKLNPIK